MMARTTIASEPRDPMRAAVLSMVPGLGQFYNGELRKGFLFLGVAFTNCILLSVMLQVPPFVIWMLDQNGMHLELRYHTNWVLLKALRAMEFGSPVSLVVLGMTFAFATYAMRDAYTNAPSKRHSGKTENSSLALSEIASGIYILQASFIILLTVSAYYFFVPPPSKSRILTLEFDVFTYHEFDCHLPRFTNPTKEALFNQNQKAHGVQSEAMIRGTNMKKSLNTHCAVPGNPISKVEQDYFSGYKKEFQCRIKRAWFPPSQSETRRIKVMFKICRNGEIGDLRISSSSGCLLADQAALEAVRNASPFKHLPDNAPESFDVEFIFDNHVSTLTVPLI